MRNFFGFTEEFLIERAENCTGYLQQAVKKPRYYRKEQVLPFNPFLSSYSHLDWEETLNGLSQVWQQNGWGQERVKGLVCIPILRTILKSYKLAKKWEIYFCLYQKWRMREHKADNITLKLCLSLVCKVKFCEDFPQSSIKNRKQHKKE